MDFRAHVFSRYRSLQGSELASDGAAVDTGRMFRHWDALYGRHLPRARDVRILEVGCGDGAFLGFLRSRGYEDVRGVDISPEQVQAAQGRGIPGVELGDLREALRRTDSSLDLLIARDVFEHFPKQELFEVLGLGRNALRPGGRLLAQVPNGQGLFAGSIIHGDMTHEVAFTASSAAQLFRAAGFDAVRTLDCGPTPTSLTATLRWALWQCVQGAARLAQAVETGSPDGHFTRNIIVIADRSAGTTPDAP